MTLMVALGVGSCVGALLSATSVRSSRGARTRLIVAILVALYLSFGLVYSSDTLRLYGAPIPVGGLERLPGGNWVDFVGPLGILAAGPNLLFWIGLALAPQSVPYWYKRLAAVGWSKAILVAALIGIIGVVALYAARAVEQVLAPTHVVVLRNRTSQTLRSIGVQCDRTIQYASKLPPGEEWAFVCDGEVSVPRIWKRQTLLGRCDDAAGKHNGFVITVSGSDGDVVECETLPR